MRSRLIWAGVATAAAAAVGLWLWRGNPAGASDRPDHAVADGPHASSRTSAAPREPRASWLRPRLKRPAPATKAGTVTVGGITIEGAGIYDPESPEVKANLFEFKKSRLRFALYDAATDCWAGGDDVSDLEVTYTMIVEGEVLRLENVAMTDSTMPDPEIERCIVTQLRELRSPATDIPDLREDGSSWISLHDLYTRGRRQR